MFTLAQTDHDHVISVMYSRCSFHDM